MFGYSTCPRSLTSLEARKGYVGGAPVVLVIVWRVCWVMIGAMVCSYSGYLVWFGCGAFYWLLCLFLGWIWDIWGVLLVYLLDALTVCFGLV